MTCGSVTAHMWCQETPVGQFFSCHLYMVPGTELKSPDLLGKDLYLVRHLTGPNKNVLKGHCFMANCHLPFFISLSFFFFLRQCHTTEPRLAPNRYCASLLNAGIIDVCH